MKKFIVLLAGTMFVLGVTLCPGYAQPKQERKAGPTPIPKQNTIHIGVDEKDKKDAAASDQKAVTAESPAPADTKAPVKDTKKGKKGKKTKKTKKTE